MSYNSVMKGLEEAIGINKGEVKGRKIKIKVTPSHDFNPAQIRQLRMALSLTQVVFAELLGVSKKTVEAWEKGTNIPNGSARRILSLLKDDPTLITKYKLIEYETKQ